MRLTRGLSGLELTRLLEIYGYRVTRQTGSHIRLTTDQCGEHHITIPNHKDIRVGTLNSILVDIADHLGMSRDELLKVLFTK